MEVFPDKLRGRLSSSALSKLYELRNNKLNSFLSDVIDLCEPESIYLVEGTMEDIEYVKRRALETGEELPLSTKTHTIHFDHPLDQARAREDTFILGDKIPFVNTKPKEEGKKKKSCLSSREQ